MPKAVTKLRKRTAKSNKSSSSCQFLSCCKPLSVGRILLIVVGSALCVLLGMEWENRNLLWQMMGSKLVVQEKTLPLQQQQQDEKEDGSSSSSNSGVVAMEKKSSSYPKIEFSFDQPIFSLSLPNTGLAILPRYFECAGHYDGFGRYWTSFDPKKDKKRQPIGKCMQTNMNTPASPWSTGNDHTGNNAGTILEGCGKFNIWHDLQYRQSGPPLNPKTIQGYCFDVVLFSGGLQKLYDAKPNATILLQIKEPTLWYKTLSYDIHRHWNDWCNPTHNNNFPNQNTPEAYIEFYHSYHQKIRDFVKTHSGWTLIELDMTIDTIETHQAIASRLQQQLGIDSKCWMASVGGKIPTLFGSTGQQSQLQTNQSTNLGGVITATLPRPNDITYPILVVGLPKSGTGTTDVYFDCTLGRFMSAHQWTFHNLEINQTTGITVGECFQTNVQSNQPPLHNCGNARTYADIGIFNPNEHKCYYPTLHGGLEAFAKAYPYATILLNIRNAESWTKSIEKWADLKGRWAWNQQKDHANCPNTFPQPNAPTTEWIDFYNRHTQSIRDFVTQHPTLTYIEIPMTENTGLIVSNVFGFQKECWPGLHNVNIGAAMPAFTGIQL